MESTIHPMPFICDPMNMFVSNIAVWESLSFFILSEVLFRDESSPYYSVEVQVGSVQVLMGEFGLDGVFNKGQTFRKVGPLE